MAPTRYAGRFDGPGIDDSEPGPDTISALFTGDGTVIADPVSFPWSLVDDDGWRQPVIVDLQRCTDTDLVALKTVLPVLTPDDRVIASVEQRQTLARELPLPDDAFLDAVPDDAAALFAELRERKLQRAVLREALGPVVRDELWATVGIEASRPLTVLEVGADDGWTEALLPKPHSLRRAADADALEPDSAAIVVLHGRAVSAAAIAGARRALNPGGLLVFVLDDAAVHGTSGPAPAELIALMNESTSHHHVVEHVWVLSERPGRPATGGLITIRPLGGATAPSEPTA